MTDDDATGDDATVAGEPAAPIPTPWSEVPGQAIFTADVVGTVALAAATALDALVAADATAIVNLVVSGVLFLGGCVAFAVGFVRAAGRSRTEVVDLAGLFYLTGSAPLSARRRFLYLWFVQIALAVVAVAVTSPPFAVMAPVWGIGVLTLWASRHATFATRPTTRPR